MKEIAPIAFICSLAFAFGFLVSSLSRQTIEEREDFVSPIVECRIYNDDPNAKHTGTVQLKGSWIGDYEFMDRTSGFLMRYDIPVSSVSIIGNPARAHLEVFTVPDFRVVHVELFERTEYESEAHWGATKDLASILHDDWYENGTHDKREIWIDIDPTKEHGIRFWLYPTKRLKR